ncbi:MAG: restriction endonuclease subunit S [Deltaproteobacteria bacterium]|jgi:type I restriction enzyme S subunit|nr:restriction endonuclease subunit S [Deltaproteobacteria bacterium]
MIRPEMLCPSWPQKPLGEVVEFLDHLRRPVTDRDRVSGPYPYYGANGQQDSVADYIFDEPLILMAEDGGYFGDPDRTIAYRVDGKCWVNNHAHVLRPKDGVDIGFLCRQLEKYDVTKFIKGATRQKLNKSNASEIPITLPSLAEQKRIAAILDKADAIRRKRRQAMQLADEFLRSVFLDMFGDPVINPNKWDMKSIGSIAIKFSDGPFGSNLKTSHYVDAGIRVVRLQNIGVDEFLDYDRKYISLAHFRKLIKHRCIPGDLIIGTLGEPNLRACILPPYIAEALNKADCIQFRVDPDQATSEYVCSLINQPGMLTLAYSLMHGQTRTRISMGTLKNLKIPVPPIFEQKRFSSIYHHQKKIISKYKKTLIESDTFFASLNQKAFRGEL